MGLIRASHLLLLMHWTAGQYGAAEQAALEDDRARARGRRPDARDPGSSRRCATCSTYGPTPVDEAAARCAHLLEEVGGDQKADALIRASLARLEAMRGNFEEARQLYRRSRATLEEFGWNLFAALTSIDSGIGRAPRQRPGRRRGRAPARLRNARRDGRAQLHRHHAAYLAFALLLQGKYDEADRFVTFSEETAAAGRPDVAVPLAAVPREAAVDRTTSTTTRIALALRAVELTDQTEETESQGNSRLDLAHVYSRAGKIPEAQTAFREAQERFERKGHRRARRRRPATPRRAQ